MFSISSLMVCWLDIIERCSGPAAEWSFTYVSLVGDMKLEVFVRSVSAGLGENDLGLPPSVIDIIRSS